MANQNIINELKKSPLFNISLCSKELSHSNFWAWLIEITINNKNPFIEVFYPTFYTDQNSFVDVKREEDHIDLKINYKNSFGQDRCIIIENKIKSIPTYEQLYVYQTKNSSSFERGVLTGVLPTLDLSAHSEWSFMSYKSIASRIEQINNRNKQYLSSFEYELINHYCKDVSNISLLLEQEIKDNSNKYIIDPDSSIESLRFGDVLLKLNAASFSSYLKEQIEKDNTVLNSHYGLPMVEDSFNNKRSTITVIYKEPLPKSENKGELNEKGRIGVQIQGEQFRIYAGPSYNESRYKDPRILKDNFTALGWFENYSNKQIRGEDSKMNQGQGYCKYEKNYLHMYQHWTIVQSDFDYLYNKIKQELLIAKDLIDKDKIHF